MSTTKNPNPKLTFFFVLNYKTCQVFRGFEQLSSSISWQAMAFGQKWPWLSFVRFQFFSTFGF